MRTDPAYRKITADEFLEMDFGTDRRFELEDGVIVMVAGGTEPHAWVQGNIYVWLRHHLKETPCRPYGSDMALRASETDVRYPDITIYCDQPPREDLADARTLGDPTVIVEVLSPSTTALDQGTKLDEYKRLASVRTIAFVDPINRMCRTVERTSQTGWLDQMFSAKHGIAVPTLGFTIPPEDIFADD